MGKILIIKGSNFSNVAVSTVTLPEEPGTTPNYVMDVSLWESETLDIASGDISTNYGYHTWGYACGVLGTVHGVRIWKNDTNADSVYNVNKIDGENLTITQIMTIELSNLQTGGNNVNFDEGIVVKDDDFIGVTGGSGMLIFKDQSNTSLPKTIGRWSEIDNYASLTTDIIYPLADSSTSRPAGNWFPILPYKLI